MALEDRRVPRCMSTQHPDNVTVPFFAQGPVMEGVDEIREAYYAFSHLGCDEQMWDFEGKEVDEFVVEKLLTTYEGFFRLFPLGRAVYLTLRVPNPAVDKAQGKILLEVLQAIPRAYDVARLFYGEDLAPIFEIIFPMTTSAEGTRPGPALLPGLRHGERGNEPDPRRPPPAGLDRGVPAQDDSGHPPRRGRDVPPSGRCHRRELPSGQGPAVSARVPGPVGPRPELRHVGGGPPR